MKDYYLVITPDLLIKRKFLSSYECVGCEFSLLPVVLFTPRDLLDHVEMHRHSGHHIPADAFERVKQELL